MRKICVITGSRAEYGLLYWLLKAIKQDRSLQLQLVVTGSHLVKRFGETYKQILADGFKIMAKVRLPLDSDQDDQLAAATGEATKGMAKAFKRLKPDLVVVLGDRYEILAAVTAATLMRIPIAHIHGGEVTEGAYDDVIRHAITKMASLHFVAHEAYARRVKQLGENPKQIYNVGALGLESIRKLKLFSKEELEPSLGIRLGLDTAVITFHPETLAKGQAARQVKDLLKALKQSNLRLIFTLPNADAENKVIYQQISGFVKKNKGCAKLFASLGQLKYLSLLKHVGLMIGNSSSGIIEAPSFNLPVVNIGQRQKGRIRAKNIIDVEIKAGAISKGINQAVSFRFKASLQDMVNPFGDGLASQKILTVIKKARLTALKKKFYDLPGAKAIGEPIVLIGAGGHCQVIIDAIEQTGRYNIIGIVDKKNKGKTVMGFTIIGDDSILADLMAQGCQNAFIAIGSIGDAALRHKLSSKLTKLGFKQPTIIHPSASVAKGAKLMPGSFVGPQAVVGPRAIIGRLAIVNSRASIDHDCQLGDFVHIAPGVVLSGGVNVGSKTHIGTGTTVIQYITIGANALIGSGSNVVKNIPANVKAYGNPCRVKEKISA